MEDKRIREAPRQRAEANPAIPTFFTFCTFIAMGRNYQASLPFIVIFAVTSINSCGQITAPYRDNRTGTEHKESAINSKLEYMVFGVFCGECSGHCATMYRYNITDSTNTLWVDTTDSYFTNYGNIQYKTLITDPKKSSLTDSIAQKIPKIFLTTTLLKETFGCPDCTDGCGIYVELGEGGTRKQFYIDYQTGKLPESVKTFADLLKKKVFQIGAK
jgi:hypothetical protein